ncbi:MAG: NAD(P)H-hydrate epimerase [Candidatus Endobugula sp.]
MVIMAIVALKIGDERKGAAVIFRWLAYNKLLYFYLYFFYMSFSMSALSTTNSASRAAYDLCSSSLYLARQVKELDCLVMQHEGIASTVLMKRAGRHAFACLLERWPQTTALHVFCGAGNNGGDGYVIAALAKQRNIKVTLWSFGEPAKESAAFAACEYALREGVESQVFTLAAFVDSQSMQDPQTVIVDALLGTGSQGTLRGNIFDAVTAINTVKQAHSWPVLAIDIPTGVNADTGAVATVAITADATISFIGQKQGLFTGAGRSHSGKRYFSDLEVDEEWLHLVNPSSQLLILDDALASLPARSGAAHKGDCGHLLVIGGDSGVGYGYGGAPIMAAQMALRSGAGLVSLAIQPAFVAAALARQPELMVAGIESGQALLPMIERATGIVIGTGLGQSAWSEQLLYQVLEITIQPLVVDADALRLLAQPRFAGLSAITPKDRQWVLTPHPGEAATLLDCSVVEIQADRFAAAQAIQQQYGGAVILKGAGTIVVTSSGDQYICDAGNSGMASAGMGDVLSGLVGALLVQGMSIDNAAMLGAVLHSSAADHAVKTSGQRSLLATDIIPAVQMLLTEV